MANSKIKEKIETVMHSQVQPWNMVKSAGSYKTPTSHPWRPVFGDEAVDVISPTAQPVTSLLADVCYTPRGMMTEPLKFPNLVTGFDRNPIHAARAALHTRYTAYDWRQNQSRLYNEADTNRNYSEKLRRDTARLIRKVDEKVQITQAETQGLKEGLTDIASREKEVVLELKELIIENDNMQDCRRNLQTAIQKLEGQLHIAQECLHQRESRKSTDLVHDEAESTLLKEVEMLRNHQKKLECFCDKCVNQLANGKAAQNQLIDMQNEETALDDIEKYDLRQRILDLDSYRDMVKKSQTERTKSSQLRDDIDTVMKEIECDMQKAWVNTNNALARRSAEMLEAKAKLHTHLQKIRQEIFDVEKSLELIQKAIIDNSSALKVVRTQLDTRYLDAEPCKDHPQLRIIKEVENINETIYCMNMNLQKLKVQHQQLLRTRANLESDLKSKIDTLFIDANKCMGIRRSYPISSTMEFLHV